MNSTEPDEVFEMEIAVIDAVTEEFIEDLAWKV
jgi:hypothetical protein